MIIVALLMSMVMGERPLNSMLSEDSPYYKYLGENTTNLFSYDNIAQVLKSKAFEQIVNMQENNKMWKSDMPEKLWYVTNEVLESTDLDTVKKMTEDLIKKPLVEQQRDIEDYEPKEWFTNTSNSEYLEQFLIGLALIDQFDNSEDCLNTLIAFNDDWTQFGNNWTLEFQYTAPEERRYVYPLMNFTKMINEQFSYIPPYCYRFIFVEVWNWGTELYESMENDFNFLLISFLFTQMGNAQKFKNAIDKIQQNSEAQVYPLVFHEFGRILNLILLQIEPLTRRGTLDTSKSGFDYFMSSYPELQNFTSIEGVMEEIQMRIPKEYYSEDYQMTIGDEVSTGIIIASGLGIAYVLEQHKEGKEIISLEQLKKLDGKKFLIDQGLQLKNDFVEFRQLDSHNKQIEFIEGKTLDTLGFENTAFNRKMLDYVAGPVLTPFMDAIPVVGDHNDERADTWEEMWEFIIGFKDGVVGVTGEESKSYLCNSNITIADQVWYTDYDTLVKDEEKWTEEAQEESLYEFAVLLQESLKWPYHTLYNCYWAGQELYTPVDEQEQPVLPWNVDERGETRTLGFFEQIVNNLIFNLGYQILDIVWYVQLTQDEEEYFYRVGYVAGDIYMRFFFRSLYDAPYR